MSAGFELESRVVPKKLVRKGEREPDALTRALAEQERLKALEERIEREHYAIQLLPEARDGVSKDFLERPFEFALQHGEIIKDEAEREEIVWKMNGETTTFVLKRIQTSRKGLSVDHELRMLQRAELLGLPAPKPLGIMQFKDDGPAFLLMNFVSGTSGVDLYEKLAKKGDEPHDIERKLDVVCKKLQALAQRFRDKMGVDKRWYVKDCLIHFSDDGEVQDVFPLDWELAHPYDPDKPEVVDTLEIIRARRTRHAGRRGQATSS